MTDLRGIINPSWNRRYRETEKKVWVVVTPSRLHISLISFQTLDTFFSKLSIVVRLFSVVLRSICLSNTNTVFTTAYT